MATNATSTGGGNEQPSRRIAADLRDAIQRGDYQPGHQLPSGSSLMHQYGVARQTVQNAIDLLRAEGLVTSRAGAGVFVRQRPTVRRLSRNRLSREARRLGKGAFLADAAADGFTPSVEVSIRTELADERIADALAITLQDEVLVRDRVMSADGQPVQLATSRLPKAIAGGTTIENANPGPGGTYAVLEQVGYQLDHFVEFVSTRTATSDEAKSLATEPGTPVLTVTRIAYSTGGQPVEINDMVMAGERYELVYEIAAE